MLKSHVRSVVALLLATGLLVGALFPLDALSLVEPELLVSVPPTGGYTPRNIDAIEVRDTALGEIVFVTWNEGAYCGGGTPATAWKVVIDPMSGLPATPTFEQELSLIQTVRGTIFEATDGTLFTGGGWCGSKPPYVSADGGETWRAANTGVYPLTSTFSYCEVGGQVYAGSGYEPFHGRVFRWNGGPVDDWVQVLDIDPPRSIVSALVGFGDKLFVGTYIYWAGGADLCEGSVPVYVSADGSTFLPTTGIPSCDTVFIGGLLVADGNLLAFTWSVQDAADRTLYRWDSVAGEWVHQAEFPLLTTVSLAQPMVTDGKDLFFYGEQPGGPEGIYESCDLGMSWELLTAWNESDPFCMTAQHDALYIGTYREATRDASIFRINLEIQVALDLKPGSCPNPFNQRSNGVTPAAVLGTADFDVSTVDVSSLRLEGSIVPSLQGFEDVSRPGIGPECPCSSEGPDGYLDLLLKIPTPALAGALGPLSVGQEVEVTLTGTLLDGTPLSGTDCLRAVGKMDDRPVGRITGLKQIQPNPFNPLTEITFSLGGELPVELAVFDARGSLVEVLVRGTLPAGDHLVPWHARSLASGSYIVRLTAGDEVTTRKLTLLK